MNVIEGIKKIPKTPTQITIDKEHKSEVEEAMEEAKLINNAELMTDAEIYEKLKEGLDQAEQGKVYDAAEAFDALRKKFSEK